MKFVFMGAKKDPVSGNAKFVISGGKGLPRPKFTKSLAVLILANLVPIIGVAFFGWTLFEVLYLYLLESAVIGIYNVPKLAMVRAPARDRVRSIFGFLGTYGFFLGAEFLGLAGLFGGPGETMLTNGKITGEAFKVFVRHADVVTVALATLFISHGISFFMNFIGKKEYLVATLVGQQSAPFRRVFVMHFTAGLGSLLSFKLGSPIPTLVLLGLLKMAFDADAHVREHAQAARKQKDMPSPAEMQKLLEASRIEIERTYLKGKIFPRILKLLLSTAGKKFDLYHKVPGNAPGANPSRDFRINPSASQEKEHNTRRP